MFLFAITSIKIFFVKSCSVYTKYRISNSVCFINTDLFVFRPHKRGLFQFDDTSSLKHAN